MVGTLHEAKTLAGLRAAVARAHGRLEPSPWFTPSPIGDTPPHGRVTWLGSAERGRASERTALACVDPSGMATLAGTVLVVPR